MRNETTVPPDLLPPQDRQPASPASPDLEQDPPLVDPTVEPLHKDTEFFPEEILDEDPELGSPEGVANDVAEVDVLESIPEIRPDQLPDPIPDLQGDSGDI